MAQDDIQGQVVDGAGNPVEDAIVELTRSYQSNPADEQVVLRTTTDSNGEYRFFYHPDGDDTTQEWHVSAYNHDGTAYVNSFNNPGVTAELRSNAIPDSVVSRPADNSSDTATKQFGVVINSNVEWPSIGAQLSANVGSNVSTAYLYRVSDSALIQSTDISGLSSGGSFAFDDVYLAANTDYTIVVDNNGSSYTGGFPSSFAPPFTSDDGDLKIVDGAKGSNQDKFVNGNNIVSVGNVGFS